jgi:CYTH domain-containing protein/predicted ATPase
MAQEIERRFLLRGFPSIDNNVGVKKIDQGYLELSSAMDSFRVRILGDKSAVLTLKDGRGISREEDEESISLSMAQKLLKKCHHKLTKLRIVYEGWEIDILGDVLTGIVLAEKELGSEDEDLEIPEWLKPFIIREVTDSLTNLHLARLASDLRGTDLLANIYLERHLKSIKKYVLTGGPCSGKSTIMEILRREHSNCHFVPEVATIIISQLGILPGNDALSQNRFQRAIYRTQKLFEATSIEYALGQNMDAVVFDRGSLDGAAYVPGGLEEFVRIIGTHEPAEFKCYDSVVYISIPPKDIYELNKANNPARRENFEQAKELGDKILEAWQWHPSLYKATSDSWEEKVQAVKKYLNLGTN